MKRNNIKPAASGAATKSNPRQRQTRAFAAMQIPPQQLTRREFLCAGGPPSTVAGHDDRPPFTPARFARVLDWHEESVRRKLRKREWASYIVGRRRLIPASEVDRIMSEGFVSRAV
jgi:hypothetical protein